METLNLTTSKNESSTVQNAKAFGISKARLDIMNFPNFWDF